MSTRQRKLSKDEIRAAFAADCNLAPSILAPAQLAALLGLSVKTIYEWLTAGRLDGTFRKRGKHILIWRDRALDLLFNGPDWKND